MDCCSKMGGTWTGYMWTVIARGWVTRTVAARMGHRCTWTIVARGGHMDWVNVDCCSTGGTWTG